MIANLDPEKKQGLINKAKEIKQLLGGAHTKQEIEELKSQLD